MGFFLAFLVGVVLGLLGGGGSILTLPILVYFMDVSPTLATAYSLFIVGVSALVAAFRFASKKQINFKVGIWFAIPSFIGVFISRKWLLAYIPDILFSNYSFAISKDVFLLFFFAFIMLCAGLSMIFSKRKAITNVKMNYPIIILDGLLVGLLTGLVGAGGGFLIVPALVLLSGLEIKKAIGTSLMIIAFKSLFGFLGDLGENIDWILLLTFTVVSSTGIFVGIFVSKYVDGKNLKNYFAIFVIVISIVIFVKEFAAL